MRLQSMEAIKTAVYNEVVKHQYEGIFKERKRSGPPRVSSSGEDRLMHRVSDHSRSPMSSTKIQANLTNTSTIN